MASLRCEVRGGFFILPPTLSGRIPNAMHTFGLIMKF